MKGKVQPRPYGDNPELEFKIQHMMQLNEVRDKMIKEVHVMVPSEEVTERFVQEFSSKILALNAKRRKGEEQKEKANATLRMSVVDRSLGVTLNTYSRKYKVALTSELADYLEEMELKYTLT